MTREEAENYVWEVHDTYFVQHPKAQTYTPNALYALLEDLLPTEDERQDLYEAMGVETCVQCLQNAGVDLETFCPWGAVCTQVFKDDEP